MGRWAQAGWETFVGALEVRWVARKGRTRRQAMVFKNVSEQISQLKGGCETPKNFFTPQKV